MPNHARTEQNRTSLGSSESLILAATCLAVGDANLLVILLLVIVGVVVLAGGDPKTALTVVKGGILTSKVNSLALVAVVAATLRESASTGGKLR